MSDSRNNTPLASVKSAGTMFVFALFALLLIAFINELTHLPIADNQHNKLIGKLESISDRNADIAWHNLDVYVLPIVLCDDKNRHLGWLDQISADGYAGSIDLLIGLNASHTITGLTVLRHQETPGIGDVIEAEKTTWLENFTGLDTVEAHSPPWNVTTHGGDFEAITGATITTKAVLASVQAALIEHPWHTTDTGETPCN